MSYAPPAVPPEISPVDRSRAEAPDPGWLVPIGGALADPAIFERFLVLCGGAGARLVIVPVASRLPRTGAEYADMFRRHGAGDVAVLDVRTRTDSEHPDALSSLERADGVFFTGGDQVRLAEVLGGTPIARVLRRRWAGEALPVAGTSAGASYLSERMIARGWAGPPRAVVRPLVDYDTLRVRVVPAGARVALAARGGVPPDGLAVPAPPPRLP